MATATNTTIQDDRLSRELYECEPTWDEEYCDYCESEGHTFRTCSHRDDGS
jgi:hypothetical protein